MIVTLAANRLASPCCVLIILLSLPSHLTGHSALPTSRKRAFSYLLTVLTLLLAVLCCARISTICVACSLTRVHTHTQSSERNGQPLNLSHSFNGHSNQPGSSLIRRGAPQTVPAETARCETQLLLIKLPSHSDPFISTPSRKQSSAHTKLCRPCTLAVRDQVI